jgi:hypothetical protein
VTTLAELEERRARECRLTPVRALETLDDAEEFLRDRGLLTRTGDSALPSLFEACHEEPYARDSPGFGRWPATKFPWFGQLGARGYLTLAVHRGKSLLVTDEIADILDPICRAEVTRLESADEDWGRLLRAGSPGAGTGTTPSSASSSQLGGSPGSRATWRPAESAALLHSPDHISPVWRNGPAGPFFVTGTG